MRYTIPSIILHWLMAVLIVMLLVIGFIMVGIPFGADKFFVYQWHKSFGILVLLLVALRIYFRLKQTMPLPAILPQWQKRAAHATHLALYAAMILMPLSGWLMVSLSPLQIPTLFFGGVEWPHLPVPQSWINEGTADMAKDAHEIIAWALIGLITLHVGAAMQHLFKRDGIIYRMLPLKWFKPLMILLFLPLPLYAAPLWQTDYAQSKIAFTATMNGGEFSGAFEKWSAEIAFDPKDLASSFIVATIDTASAKTGAKDKDSAMPGKDWFDAAQFQTATFKSESIVARDAAKGEYLAKGALTIKGITKPIELPFTVQIDGNKAQATSQITLQRNDYSIGVGEWAGDQWIAFPVRVEIAVRASR